MGPPAARFYAELLAKLARVDADLGAVAARFANVEVCTVFEAEVADTVPQRHEAAGQAQQGYFAELRDAAASPSAAAQQLINEARG
eukprot:7650517-Alexandrium_andersonii.AAC.1